MQLTNPNQFTEKAWEAIVRLPEIAKQNQQQQIKSEHLLKSLLEQDRLASSVFSQADVSVQCLRDRAENPSNYLAKYWLCFGN